jgi:hypothetical protein
MKIVGNRNLEAWGSMADFYSFQLPHTTQITVRTTENSCNMSTTPSTKARRV